MAIAAVCRIGDQNHGICTQHAGGNTAWTGVWATGSPTFSADGLAVVRAGDTGLCSCGHTFQAVAGSGILGGGGLSIQRVGDTVTVIGGGNGVSDTGSPVLTSV